MKTQLPQKYIFAPALFLLAIFGLTTCQKESNSPQKIVAQAQHYFESQVLSDTSQKVSDNNPRHSVAKEPLWAEATIESMPFGEAVVVPLVYTQAISLQTEKGPIPLSELSYLLLYKDVQKHYHSEVITKLPEKNYWQNYKNPNITFKGVILVEDWWGNTSRNIGLGISGPENLLGYVIPQAKGQKPGSGNMMLGEQHCYNQVWEITVCGGGAEGCTTHNEIDQVCFTMYTDTGNGGGGGIGSGYPSPIDYGFMPHAGGGYNTPPPPTNLADITNNVTNPLLKAIVNELKTANMAGKIGEIITALDKNTKVQISVVDVLELYNPQGKSVAAQFSSPPTLINGVFSGTLKININTLLPTTKENTASSIIHEIVHAYFAYTGQKNLQEIEHQKMATDYIQPMASYLSGLYNMPIKDATALAWTGLYDANSYINSDIFSYPGGTMTKYELGNIYRDYVMKYSGHPVFNAE
ncbi:MAG: hypothetical protein ACKOWL_03835 [Sphingobacteriaceae bacterium]